MIISGGGILVKVSKRNVPITTDTSMTDPLMGSKRMKAAAATMPELAA